MTKRDDCPDHKGDHAPSPSLWLSGRLSALQRGETGIVDIIDTHTDEELSADLEREARWGRRVAEGVAAGLNQWERSPTK